MLKVTKPVIFPKVNLSLEIPFQIIVDVVMVTVQFHQPSAEEYNLDVKGLHAKEW